MLLRKSPAPGIRRHGAGWQVCAKFRGERLFQQFPIEAALSEMLEWQQDTVAELRLQIRDRPTGGTFAADCDKYLSIPSVRAMPTYVERKQHIEEWVDVFGPRRRRTIRSFDIEQQCARLAEDGYAASSINKRLRALSNVWTKLDGRRAPNPVREVTEFEEPDPEARALPYELIEAIIDAMPETAVGVKKDGTRTTGKNVARENKTKARLRVMAYTGLSQKQLGLLQASDVDLEAGTMRLVARRKGRKLQRASDRALPQLVPLVPQAIDAFRTFAALNCWGPFSNSTMHRGFQSVCRQLGLTGLKPYDLRHSAATAVYRATRDLRATGALLGHRSERTTLRYTMAAVAPHISEAIEKFGAALPRKAGPAVDPDAKVDASDREK